MASSHYNSNSLKNLVNLRNNEEKRLEVDEDEEDNWSDIEFDDGEVDKEQSLLLTTSINVKENLIDTPAPIRKLNTKAKRNKKEDGVMVIDVEDEDWDVPELDSEDATLNEKDNNVIPNVEKDKSKQAKLQRKRKSNDLSSGPDEEYEAENSLSKSPRQITRRSKSKLQIKPISDPSSEDKKKRNSDLQLLPKSNAQTSTADENSSASNLEGPITKHTKPLRIQIKRISSQPEVDNQVASVNPVLLLDPSDKVIIRDSDEESVSSEAPTVIDVKVDSDQTGVISDQASNDPDLQRITRTNSESQARNTRPFNTQIKPVLVPVLSSDQESESDSSEAQDLQIEIQGVQSLATNAEGIKAEDHPILSFADTNEPFAIKQLHICPCCKQYFLTPLSVSKHIESYHKIPLPVQKEMNLEVKCQKM